jgi:hypothetical protein
MSIVGRRYPIHYNCTYILPGKLRPEAPVKWMRERTHGCCCSAWRMTANGLRIWRSGAWRKPKPGELRSTEREPPNSGIDPTSGKVEI